MATVAGYYLITHQITFATNSTGVRGSDIRLNGSATYPIQLRTNAVGGGFGTTVGSSKVLKLAAGDYLEHYAFQNSGGSLASCVFNFQSVFLGT